MLARILLTPSVMTVSRGTGAGSSSLMSRSPRTQRLEQTQLLPAALRFCKMIGGQFRAPLVEAKLLAGDFEAASDHPGHGTGAFHPRAPLRVVIAAAAHIADQGEDVAIAIRVIRHQPFAKEIAHFQRQPQ